MNRGLYIRARLYTRRLYAVLAVICRPVPISRNCTQTRSKKKMSYLFILRPVNDTPSRGCTAAGRPCPQRPWSWIARTRSVGAHKLSHSLQLPRPRSDRPGCGRWAQSAVVLVPVQGPRVALHPLRLHLFSCGRGLCHFPFA